MMGDQAHIFVDQLAKVIECSGVAIIVGRNYTSCR